MGRKPQRLNKKHRRTFIKEWRKSRGLTLTQLADRTGSTHATISRLERGLQPYGQELLEAIAKELQTEPAVLLSMPPDDASADPTVRALIAELAKTVAIRTR